MVSAVATVSRHLSSLSSGESSFRELDDVFLQTQARIWLGEVLQETLDEHVSISDLLADGELLFHVSKVIYNLLVEKCVDLRHINAHKYNPFISRKANGGHKRYKPYSNVDSFLKICKILGLNGIDLFCPSDVVEKGDTRKVCICIRALSKKARSKQLIVPDFDVVTHSVTMPTRLVGCIRRNLERSQCSSQSSNCTSSTSSKFKFKQENSAATCDRIYDSCSEESDEAESRYMGAGSFSLSTSQSDLENLPETLPFVRRLSSVEQFVPDQCYSTGSVEPATCLSSRGIKNDCDTNALKNFHMQHRYERMPLDHDVEQCLGNDRSLAGVSLDENEAEFSYISNGLTFSDLIALATDGNSPMLFNGGDMFNISKCSDSMGSSSKQMTFQNGIRRKYSDEIDDVEVSSTDSMSSVFGRMLNLDFDDQFDEQDFRIAKDSYTQMPEIESDRGDWNAAMESGYEDMHERQGSMHNVCLETDEPNFKTKVQNTVFPSDCLSIHREDGQTHCVEHQNVKLVNNKSGISRRYSGKILCLEDQDLVNSDSDDIFNKENNYMGCSMHNTKCHRVKNVREYSHALCQSISVEQYGGKLQNHHHQVINPSIAYGQCAQKVANGVKSHGCILCQNQYGDASEANLCPTDRELQNAEKIDQLHVAQNQYPYSLQSANKDAIKLDRKISTEKNSDIMENTGIESQKEKNGLKPLLKTVAKGTALVGAIFLLLHIRNRSGRESMSEARRQPGQNPKSRGLKLSSEKVQKGSSSTDGTYPAKNFKFGF